jgi:hypothetical protein
VDTGEITLAKAVLPSLRPGMLCLADRNFYGFALWTQARETGAELLWRIKQNLRLPCEQRLPDGSYLSRIYATPTDHRHRRDGLVVRVIAYRLAGVPGAEPLYRLLTTILDSDAAPAAEMAALYHERWEIETALDELKTHLRGARIVLRSKTPDLVIQEFYGLLLAHFAVCGLMHEAALKGRADPDRLSFVHAVRVVRRTLPRVAALPPPQDRPAFHEAVLRELLEERVVSSRSRRTPRGVKRKMSSYPLRPRTRDGTRTCSLVIRIKILK